MRLMAATRFHPEETLLWSVGLLFALSLHLGVVLGVLLWGDDTTPPPLSSAVMMELAALPVAPPKPEPVPEPEPEPVPEPKPEPKPKPEPIIPPPPPKPKPEPVPEIAPVVEPEVALPAPPKVEPEPRRRPTTPAEAAPVPEAPEARSTQVAQTWQQKLLAHLGRYKRYPIVARRRGQEGVVYLHFVMNRQGQVLFREIRKSSGYTLLDEETLALIERAEPLPAPPPEISGRQLTFTVPVQFFIRK